MPLVIMTGAWGSGKTAIAKAIEVGQPSILVFRFDTIGVPSADVMASFGTAHQPGGAWQRAMTLKWFERIAPILAIACTKSLVVVAARKERNNEHLPTTNAQI